MPSRPPAQRLGPAPQRCSPKSSACATSTSRNGWRPTAWVRTRLQGFIAIRKRWNARHEVSQKPIIFARCRSIAACRGAPGAGPGSPGGCRKASGGRTRSSFRQRQRQFYRIQPLNNRRIRGTAGSPSAGCGSHVVVLIFVVVFVVVVGLTGRGMRFVALIVPEPAIGAVGGQQLGV